MQILLNDEISRKLLPAELLLTSNKPLPMMGRGMGPGNFNPK